MYMVRQCTGNEAFWSLVACAHIHKFTYLNLCHALFLNNFFTIYGASRRTVSSKESFLMNNFLKCNSKYKKF